MLSKRHFRFILFILYVSLFPWLFHALRMPPSPSTSPYVSPCLFLCICVAFHACSYTLLRACHHLLESVCLSVLPAFCAICLCPSDRRPLILPSLVSAEAPPLFRTVLSVLLLTAMADFFIH